jgi:hypothetical protein
MSGLLSKLARVSDNASLLDALTFWAVIALVLGITFGVEIVALAVLIARVE